MTKITGFIFLWMSVGLHAQVTAIATLSPEKIETGDTFTLKILVSGTTVEPTTVRFNQWAAQFPLNNILRTSEWRRSGQQWSKVYVLIAFDSTATELPPLYVRTHLGDSVRTNPVLLRVYPTPASSDLSDMEPIRDIRREATNWTDYWPWLLAGLAVLSGLVWWLKKRKPVPRKPISAPVTAPNTAPPPAAQVTALQRLLALEQRQLWKTGNWNTHFTEISLITREYLESRFRFPALESTTTEITQTLSDMGFPASLKGMLKDLLGRADAVKYAQSTPMEIDCLRALEKARFIIEQTTNNVVPHTDRPK